MHLANGEIKRMHLCVCVCVKMHSRSMAQHTIDCQYGYSVVRCWLFSPFVLCYSSFFLFPFFLSWQPNRCTDRRRKRKKQPIATNICISNVEKSPAKYDTCTRKREKKSTSLDFNRESMAKTKDKGIWFFVRSQSCCCCFFCRCHTMHAMHSANTVRLGILQHTLNFWNQLNRISLVFSVLFCHKLIATRNKNTTIWSM